MDTKDNFNKKEFASLCILSYLVVSVLIGFLMGIFEAMTGTDIPSYILTVCVVIFPIILAIYFYKKRRRKASNEEDKKLF